MGLPGVCIKLVPLAQLQRKWVEEQILGFICIEFLILFRN